AAIDSIQKGYTQYTSNQGLPKLRELISRYLSERCDVEYSPSNEIVVTVGASEGIDLAMRALLNVGDEVLIPEPSYVAYAPTVGLAGGVCVPLPCLVENDFKVTAEEIEKAITKKTKIIILPYPNNPTGAILEKDDLEKIAKVIIKNDLICVSDEIYSELTYGQKHVSISSVDGMWERTVLINGFSKAFAMTGWRLGYVCAPKELIVPILKIHQYCIMCAPTASQYAGVAALEQGFSDNFSVVEDMRAQYDLRRKFLLNFFKEVGMKTFEPRGAFYVFPSTNNFNMTGDEFANGLLESQKVAVVPGSAFGRSGELHVRISYAYSMKSLEKATERIEKYIEVIK
ncbi:MAG: aminotransferase class I/II-fold pyridoxal phosphate-dependent enzyme, partial [Clostridia bacterium]